MTRSIATRLLAALAAALAGCVPADGPTPPTPATTPATAKPAEPPAVLKAEVFRPPAPTGAADDPRVADAAKAGDTIAQSLAVVHQRLVDLKAAYESKAQTEGDLKDVAERLKPLVTAARTDCDAILRAARDLKAELPNAGQGYAAAAALYRERADKYRDPALADVTRRMADEFDRLAADAPRKLTLTETFVAQLVETQEFLAETERCLNDTATALKVLSAGRATPDVSAGGRTFLRRLEEFLGVVAAYQNALYPRPVPKTPPPDAAPKPTDPPATPVPTVPPPTPDQPMQLGPQPPRNAPPPPAAKPSPGGVAVVPPSPDKPPDDTPVRPRLPVPWPPPTASKPAIYPGSNPRKAPAPYPGSNPRKGPAPYPGSRR